MPIKPCEEKLALINILVERAAQLTATAACINELVQSEGALSPAQRYLDLQSLKMEMHAQMTEREWVNEQLRKHMALHQC